MKKLLLLLSMLSVCATAATIKEKKVVAADGTALHTICMMPQAKGRCKGTVLFAHGLGAYATSNQEFFDYLVAQEFAVISYDLRGHGKSEGEPRGGFDDFEDLIHDMTAVYKAYQKEIVQPLYVVGFSLGGLIALLHACNKNPIIPFKGIICCTPIIKGHTHIDNKATALLWNVLTKIAPNTPIIVALDKIKTPWTHDKKMIEHYITNKATFLATVPVHAFKQLEEARFYLEKNKKYINVPVHVLLADDDRIIDNKKTLAFLATLPAKNLTSSYMFKNMYHCILHEQERKQVYAHIVEKLISYTKAK